MKYKEQFFEALRNTIFQYGETMENFNGCIPILVDCFKFVKKNKANAFFIGNGGSAGIAIHMTADYFKNGGIKTQSMFNPSTITCLGNDFGFEYIFSKQIEHIAEQQDVLVAISSSGKSKNILNAVEVAKFNGCKVVTFSGFEKNNQLRKLGQYNIYVPSMSYGIVESIHNMILQQIVDEIYMESNRN